VGHRDEIESFGWASLIIFRRGIAHREHGFYLDILPRANSSEARRDIRGPASSLRFPGVDKRSKFRAAQPSATWTRGIQFRIGQAAPGERIMPENRLIGLAVSTGTRMGVFVHRPD